MTTHSTRTEVALHLFAIAIPLGSLQAAQAVEPGAHVHGVAELRIVVDGARLDVALETPLDNVLGFEKAPRTEPQRAAVRALAGKLRQPQLLQPTPAARCQPASTRLQSAVLPPELLGESGPPAAKGKESAEGDDHADLDASFSWQCAVPAELKGLRVGLMQTFPGIRRIDVQVVGPRGQSATRLIPGKADIAW